MQSPELWPSFTPGSLFTNLILAEPSSPWSECGGMRPTQWQPSTKEAGSQADVLWSHYSKTPNPVYSNLRSTCGISTH